MEPLLFKHNIIVKRIIGVFWILTGILNLVLILPDPATFSGWVRSVIFIILGIMFFTPIMGQSETRFTANDQQLKIKWRTRIAEYIIDNNEIEKIILKTTKIEILRMNKKKVVLHFGEWLWKLEDKKKIYEFMLKYAQLKNIALEK